MIGITTIKEMIMSMVIMIIILLQCWFEFESYFVFHMCCFFNTKIMDFFEITKLYINNLYILKLNSNERIVEYQRL